MFVYLYLRHKFNLKVEKNSDRIPGRPFIMLANHGTFFDPWFVGHFSPYPVSIMMNKDAYSGPPIVRWYLRTIGTFPKKKGGSDYQAMKTTLTMLRQGYPVLVFPEGQTTWDGETQPIYSGIEKLVKRSRCNLVMMNIRGNFLSKPWWAKTFRRGAVRLRIKTVDTAALANMSEQEVLDAIVGHVRTNDLKDPRNRETRFSGVRLCEGLERFVWICRHCGREDTLTASGDTVSCTECGSSWTSDAHLRFTPATDATPIGDLHDWAAWHKQQVRRKIASASAGDTLTQSSGVALGEYDIDGVYREQAMGTLALTAEMLNFTPDSGTEHALAFSAKDVSDYVFQRKDVFECTHKGREYRFLFKEHSPMKWVFYFRYLNHYEVCEKRGYV